MSVNWRPVFDNAWLADWRGGCNLSLFRDPKLLMEDGEIFVAVASSVRRTGGLEILRPDEEGVISWLKPVAP